MDRFRISGVVALVLAIGLGPNLWLGTAEAQSLRGDDGPAEFPPASYTGRQYVDSRGCVYVRAGFDGAVTWVPRVSRDRKVLCGFEPTQIAGTTTTPPPAPAPVAAPAPRTVVAAPAPAPRTVTVAPRTVTTAPPPATAVVAPAPRVVRPAGSEVVNGVCPGVSGVSAAYMQPRDGFPVRCGPQAESPYGSYGPGSSNLIAPPPGFRPAFDDDRLNPYRGVQTLQGFAEMSTIWTQTLPRTLVDDPDEPQVREVTIVQPDGSRVETRVVVVRSSGAAVRVSTKGAEPESALPADARFVQVGLFGDEASARAAIARLQAAGLPVKVAHVTRRGKPHQIVVAGPFTTTEALRSGLDAVWKAGFRDACPRN